MLKKEILQFLTGVEQNKIPLNKQAETLLKLEQGGVTEKELSIFAAYMQKRIKAPILFTGAIDVCGTGGSGLNRINTSTLSAFVLAALGVPVAKHGNKAAGGRFGSFDLLEGLGIRIDLDEAQLEYLAAETGLAFIYARTFHPIMKHFAPVRQQLGCPTIFNLLGPLLNPAGADRQIIGTSFQDKMELIAKTCQKLNKNALIVRGEDGLDEVTLTGTTEVIELREKKIKKYNLSPADFGVRPCAFRKISGGSRKKNLRIAREILSGTCRTRHLELVLVNTALALRLAGVEKDLKRGVKRARQAIRSGRVQQRFESYRELSNASGILLKIAAGKKKEIKNFSFENVKKSKRDFKKALQRNGLSIIAEIKPASPSEGRMASQTFDVAAQAARYKQAGADAISVLTDKKYFGGNLKNLKKCEKGAPAIPLLCKDFIIDASQIYQARQNGADAILLIAALLSENQIANFLRTAQKLGMDALTEVHTEAELKKVLKTPADIIGINNRDLHSMKVDMKTTHKLIKTIPKDKVVVSESGFFRRSDVEALSGRVNAILVGTALMKHPLPELKIKELKGRPLLKICGIRCLKEAQFCEKMGVDLIGLNFVPTSLRKIGTKEAAKIKNLKKTGKVGIFQNQPLSEVNRIAKRYNLDFIQLSGNEDLIYIKQCARPVIRGISVRNRNDLRKAKKLAPYVAYLLFDGSKPGNGKGFDYNYLNKVNIPFLLAGGITSCNAKTALRTGCIGLDVASGVETGGTIDFKKIESLIKQLQ